MEWRFVHKKLPQREKLQGEKQDRVHPIEQRVDADMFCKSPKSRDEKLRPKLKDFWVLSRPCLHPYPYPAEQKRQGGAVRVAIPHLQIDGHHPPPRNCISYSLDSPAKPNVNCLLSFQKYVRGSCVEHGPNLEQTMGNRNQIYKKRLTKRITNRV